MIQGTAEWFQARCGNLTASRIYEAIARTQKGAFTAARGALMAELVAERLTGKTAMHYVSQAMKDGIVRQPAATQGYAFATGQEVDEGGFYLHPTIKDAGASPDGLIGAEGGLEIKCPTAEVFIKWLDADEAAPGYVPPEHVPQCLWGMACTGRRWWDFVAYHPDFPLDLQVFRNRVERDDIAIAKLEAEARVFLEELGAQVERLRLRQTRLAHAA